MSLLNVCLNVPSIVRSLSFTGVSDSSVLVSWQRPEYPNGIISGFRIIIEHYQRSLIDTVEIPDNTWNNILQHSSFGVCSMTVYFSLAIIVMVFLIQSPVSPTMAVWWPSTRWGRARDSHSCSTPEKLVRGCVQFEMLSLHLSSQLLLLFSLWSCAAGGWPCVLQQWGCYHSDVEGSKPSGEPRLHRTVPD